MLYCFQQWPQPLFPNLRIQTTWAIGLLVRSIECRFLIIIGSSDDPLRGLCEFSLHGAWRADSGSGLLDLTANTEFTLQHWRLNFSYANRFWRSLTEATRSVANQRPITMCELFKDAIWELSKRPLRLAPTGVGAMQHITVRVEKDRRKSSGRVARNHQQQHDSKLGHKQLENPVSCGPPFLPCAWYCVISCITIHVLAYVLFPPFKYIPTVCHTSLTRHGCTVNSSS